MIIRVFQNHQKLQNLNYLKYLNYNNKMCHLTLLTHSKIHFFRFKIVINLIILDKVQVRFLIMTKCPISVQLKSEFKTD